MATATVVKPAVLLTLRRSQFVQVLRINPEIRIALEKLLYERQAEAKKVKPEVPLRCVTLAVGPRGLSTCGCPIRLIRCSHRGQCAPAAAAVVRLFVRRCRCSSGQCRRTTFRRRNRVTGPPAHRLHAGFQCRCSAAPPTRLAVQPVAWHSAQCTLASNIARLLHVAWHSRYSGVIVGGRRLAGRPSRRRPR
jgi:hypothetical protein